MRAVAIVVMGVSGSGKSTIGRLLAQRLDCRFMEGDAFHSDASIEKMAAGVPLVDDDRWPWLDRLGGALGLAAREEKVAAAACSALKRSYRDRLRQVIGCQTAFVHLQASPGELVRRMASRKHYMPVSLLQSQLAILEPPDIDEWSKTFQVDEAAPALVGRIVDWLKQDHGFEVPKRR